jgi:hypothetical protein
MTGPIPLSQANLGLIGDIKGEVLLVEDLGSDALLHVRPTGQIRPDQAVARAAGRRPPGPRQDVAFHVQPDAVFAFHLATGARLVG